MPNFLSRRLRSVLLNGKPQPTANVSLRWVLVVPFVLQTVGAVTLVGYLSYRSGQQAIADLANQLMTKTGDLVVQELGSYVKTAELQGRSSAYALQAGYLDGSNLPALKPYLVQQLKLMPTLSTIAVANEAREFLAVGRAQPPSLIVRRFLPSGAERGFYRYRADENGENLVLQDIRQNYDPHNDPPGNPWYEAARRSPAGKWRLVVSLAQGEAAPLLNLIYMLPFNDRTGQFQGVVGTGIYLTQLGDFLQQLNVGTTGQIFLVDPEGMLVATSTGEVPFDRRPNPDHAQNVSVKPRRLPAIQSQNPLTQAATAYLRRSNWLTAPDAASVTRPDPTQQSSSFWYERQQYFVHTVPIQADLNWTAVIVVPESDYMSAIWASNYRTLVLCLLTLLGSIGLGWLTAKRITKPISQLNRASQALATGEWQEPIAVETSIAELKTLIHSCNETAAQLHQSFDRIKIALEQSEEKFTTVFRTIPDPVSIVTLAEGRILEVNNSFVEFYGYCRDQAIGRTTVELALWCSLEERQQFSTLLQQQGVVQNFEVQRRTRSGELKTVLLSAEVQTLDGQLCAITVARDISPRKAAEAALRVSEEQYRGLIEDQTELICRFRPDGTLTFVNSSYCRHYGKSEAELIGMNFLDLTLPAEREYVKQLLQDLHALTPENPLAVQEQRGLRANGQIGWQQWTNRAVFTAEGQVEFQGVGRDITDRKQAELALQASEAQLSRVLDSTRASIAQFRLFADKPWQYEYWSEGCESVFGYTAPEFLAEANLWFSHVFPEDIAQGRVGNVDRFMQDKETTAQGEYRFFHKDGSLRWISFHATSRPEPNSEWLVTVIDIDITAAKHLDAVRKQTELALEQSESRFQKLAAASPAVIYTVVEAPDQGIIRFDYLSSAAEKIHELPIADLRRDGSLVSQQMHPDDRQGYLEAVQLSLKTMQPFDYAWRIITPSGKIKWLQGNSRPERRETGEVVWHGIVAEITDRKQAELALKQTLQELNYHIENSPLATIRWNHDFQVEYWSRQAEQIFGWTAAEVLGKDFYEWRFVFEDDLNHVNQATAQLISGEDGISVNRNYRKDGSIVFCEWYNSILCDEAGNVVSILSLVQDISERKRVEDERRRAEQELQQAKEAAEAANRAKSAFLANMSHELRSPLHTILGFTQLIQRDVTLPASHQKSLQLIYKGGNHLLKLISEILNLAKIEAGRLTLNNQALNLPDLLYSMQTMYSQRASSQGIAFYLNLMPDVPQSVLADAHKLQQVLINLLSNALKFTRQGYIKLHVSVDGGHNVDVNSDVNADVNSDVNSDASADRSGYDNQNVNDRINKIAPPDIQASESFLPRTAESFLLPSAQLSNSSSAVVRFRVEDTGIGIAPEDLSLIFDPFAQASAGQQIQEGTGLGLTISRRLVQLMDGDITVQSVLGQGSIFQFAIPMQRVADEMIPAIAPELRIMRLSPGQPAYRILVVDDQPDNRLLLVQLFKQLGLDVKAAMTGQEAIERWRQWQPHLIWMDIRMPGLNGHEATRRIRAEEQRQKTAAPAVIIALTAQASEDDRILALAAGCNDYVTKPFQEKAMFAKMTEYLKLQFVDTAVTTNL